MTLIRTLFDRGLSRSRLALPDRLRDLYDGDLRFPASRATSPYVIANFVTTLDGIASFNLPDRLEGSYISGSNAGDRFIMGLLRASVDAVIVGSASFRAAGAKALWTPEYVYPSAAIQFRQYRKDVVKKPRYPLLVIVSESGSVHLANAMFHQSGMHVLIVTSERGKRRLARKGVERLSHVTVKVTAEAKRWSDPLTILKLLVQDFGARLLLHEGGPTLFGEFLAKGLVDELFLTIAPQIAGSLPAHSRPRLTAFVEFLPETAPWWKLRSAKNGEDHLYLRYSSRERRVLR